MSGTNISGRLTMRALLERNTATGIDAWGNPVGEVFAPLGAALPCFAWSNAAREIKDGDKLARVEDLRAMFSLIADIRAEDEISAITNRHGAVLILGRLRIEGPPQRKHTHLEAALKRIG
jgi:hypothetical protein